MYKEFYRFRHMPFTETVECNPNLVHLSKNYEMPLAILVSSLDKGVTLALVIGANGVGKTTFINYIRKYIERNLTVGLITSSHIQSCQELLQKTLACFGREAKQVGIGEMVRQLREFLSAQYQQQNQQPSLLIIDDADSMALDAVKSLELLLDLNSNNNRLLQVVLVGRYQLRELLNTPELQGLLKRVETQCSLEPLTAEEIRSYIDHRLNAVGMAEQKLFNEEVCSVIYECSDGIPGKINSLCDEALLRNSRQQKHEVSTALIREVADDAQQVPDQIIAHQGLPVSAISGDRRSPWIFNAVLVGGGILAGIFLIYVFAPDRFSLTPEKSQSEYSDELVESLIKENPIDLNSVQPPQEIENPVSLADGETIDDEKEQHQSSSVKIPSEQLLAKAESHLQALRLTIPKGQNALDVYHSILESDPGNKMARQGIKRVGEKYRELAENEFHQGAFGKASSYLEQAAAILPESKDIKKALIQARRRRDQAEMNKVENQQTQRANKQTAASSKDETVTKLLAVAERQFAASRLILPSKDNAYETYNAILSSAPNEKRALVGLLRIANHYLELAKQYYSEGKLDQSRSYISQGLKVSPDHHELATLKKQIDVELNRQSQQDKIDAMFKQAEQQVAALKLIQPQGDNAYQTYQAISAIDKDNQEAKQGMQKIQQHLKSQLQGALDKQDFAAVRKFAEQILAIPSYGTGNRYHEEAVFAAFETREIIADQLKSLLGLAEQQRKKQQLTQPAGDNALESYRKILEIDPANEAASEGLASLVEQYQILVRDAVSDGKINQAIVIASEGLKAFPDNRDLRELRDSVAVQRDAEALKQTEEKPAVKKQKRLRPFANF